MRDIKTRHWLVIIAFAIITLALGVSVWYGYKRVTELSENTASLSQQLAALESALSSSTALLKGDIVQTHTELSSALDQEKQNVDVKLGNVQQTVGTISGTVSTLEKLSKTDPELLQKYSKVFFLNEHYVPERVAEIDNVYLYSESRPERVHALVWTHLKALLDAALAQSMTIYVKSAYRPFDEQAALKSAYTVIYGAGTANQFSADQGYSEHQLGTTVDFITTGLGGELRGFENTQAYQWLLANAHTYGFILSYPENNSHYIFEPWHWRYVGVALATHLHDTNKHFYDLEQREIDKYLVSIFD